MTSRSRDAFERLAIRASARPSPIVARHLGLLDPALPVLDAPCGFGRNSLFLTAHGYRVVGADHDRQRLAFVASTFAAAGETKRALELVSCDLGGGGLPFASGAFGSVVVIDFVPQRWEHLIALVSPGGHLLIQTMGNQGENYRQLPRQGELRRLIELVLEPILYEERHAGPPSSDAAVVRLVAKKRF